MHIGLIGGIGPPATAFYYRRLAAASKASGIPYGSTITHAQNAPLVENFHTDRRDEQARVFAGHIRDLAAAGAEAVFLGGTDLFSTFDGHDSAYPVIDGAELHIAALADLAEKGV